MNNRKEITIIGGGLAGSEAAWQAAQKGIEVHLYEMRPHTMTPAHHSGDLAEVVCSNSLGSYLTTVASGLLKEELRRFGSLLMEAAQKNRIPAGGALAVDREGFSRYISEKIETHPNIALHREEVSEIPSDGIVIIASGPLTSPAIAQKIQELTGSQSLFFYDAAAPIVEADSLDRSIIFSASRYDKGEGEYLNCPMNQEEYERFLEALIGAELAPIKDFEAEHYFEGCLPVEVIAKRGKDTLRFGPLKPVGLTDPRTGCEPYAVVQLRQDNAAGTLYNLVGFQTRLKWGEQKRVFSLIPGMEIAEFVRFGVMHKNLFIHSPEVLDQTLQLKKDERIFFTGQICGVEGYTESITTGLVAGINAARFAQGEEPLDWPAVSMTGALLRYITTPKEKGQFQPMNANWGLLPPLERRVRKKREKNGLLAERALSALQSFKVNLSLREIHPCDKCGSTSELVEDPNIPGLFFCSDCWEERDLMLQRVEYGYDEEMEGD